MILASITRQLRRFIRGERGNVTIEFVFYTVVLFGLLGAGVEMGSINLRRALLERAVDVAVRDIRLGTGNIPSYWNVKKKMCREASFSGDCENNLMLEMVQVDPRNFTKLDDEAQCSNAREDPKPVRNFVNGQENDLMVLRVCAMIDPIFPTTGLGKSLGTGPGGQFSLVSTTVFVQEPR